MMKLIRGKIISVMLLTVVMILSSGCWSTSNPTPKDYLNGKDFDIFLLDNIVYLNSDNVEWVQNRDYTIGEEIGEIVKQTDKAKEFKNFTANKLPIGTKIYKTNKSDIYIAVVNGEQIIYMAMLEG